MYINKPETAEDLKDEIHHNIANISPQLRQYDMENFIKIINLWSKGKDGHLSDVLYHIYPPCVCFLNQQKYYTLYVYRQVTEERRAAVEMLAFGFA